MIVCPKCKAENSPAGERCAKCGFNLLPARSIGTRIAALIIGLLFVLLIIYLSTQMVAGFWIGLFILGPLAAGCFKMVGAGSIADRYEERADKYKESDPQQAIVDYTKAMETGSKSARPIYERAKLYRKLGRRDEALHDLENLRNTRYYSSVKKEVEKEIEAIRVELSQMPTPAPTQRKYCIYCGESIAIDAAYCIRCGKQQ